MILVQQHNPRSFCFMLKGWQVLLLSCLLACCLGYAPRSRPPSASSWLFTSPFSSREQETALHVATTPVPSSDQDEREKKDKYLETILSVRNKVNLPLSSSRNDTSFPNIFSSTTLPTTTTRESPIPTKSTTSKGTKKVSKVRSINKQIDILLPPKNMKINVREHHSSLLSTANELKSYLSTNREYLDKVHVLTVMYRCSKMGRSDLSEFIDLDLALSILNTIDNKPVQFRSAASALYSLHLINDSKNDDYTLFVRDMVNIVTRWLIDMKKRDEVKATGQAIAMCIVGLKNLNLHANEVRSLIKELAYLTRCSESSMNAHDVASALYGLQHMDCSTHEELDTLLGEIINKMEQSTDFRGDRRLSSKHFSMMMYGLHSTSSGSG